MIRKTSGRNIYTILQTTGLKLYKDQQENAKLKTYHKIYLHRHKKTNLN